MEVDGPSRGPRDRGAQRQTKRGAGDLNTWRKGFEAEGAAKLRSRSGEGASTRRWRRKRRGGGGPQQEEHREEEW